MHSELAPLTTWDLTVFAFSLAVLNSMVFVGIWELSSVVASMLLEQRVTSPPGNLYVPGVNQGQQGFYHLRLGLGERHQRQFFFFFDKELFFFRKRFEKHITFFVSKKHFFLMRRGLLARLEALFITASYGNVVERAKSMFVQLSLISSAGHPLHYAVSHFSDSLEKKERKTQEKKLNRKKLASRGCVRFARLPSLHWEKFQKSTHAHMCRSFDSTNPYSYPEISTVIRRQALISICGISRVRVLSFQCHLDSHRSWLMTSLKVSEIPNLEWVGISFECVSSYDLLLVSLPLHH